MLRYREALGLLPGSGEPGQHRRYEPDDLAAASLAAALEQRYRVSPAALGFALRAITDPRVTADVARLCVLTGRAMSPTRALDFDQLKAQRLLRPPAPSSPLDRFTRP